VVRGRNQFDFVGMNFHDLQFVVSKRQLGKAKIGQIIENCFPNPRPIGALYKQRHVWKAAREIGEDIRQHINTGGLVGRDDQFAPRRVLQFVDGVARLAAQVKDALRVLAENSSSLREGDAASKALE
jgi:hypothetical protein